MLKHLVNLADYFDKRNLKRYAVLVDTFIIKAAEDNTWHGNGDFPTYVGEMEPLDFESEQAESQMSNNDLSKIKLSDTAFIDLERNLLGREIMNYVYESFQIADDRVTDTVTIDASATRALIDLISKYDENLNYNKEQQNPLEPIQVKDILNQALVIGYKTYSGAGRLDINDVNESIQYLYKQYEDFYLEEILHQDAPMPEPQYDVDPQHLELPEISQQDKDKLWRQNDKYIDSANTENWLAEIEREENPVKYQQRMKQRREEDEQAYPAEWHDVLFPK